MRCWESVECAGLALSSHSALRVPTLSNRARNQNGTPSAGLITTTPTAAIAAAAAATTAASRRPTAKPANNPPATATSVV